MFRLVMLGGLRLEDASGPLTGRASQRRRLALLSLLAVPPGRLISRDKLVSYLWPESNDERARRLLSSAIYDLRQELDDAALRVTGDEIAIDPAVITSDACEFMEAADAGELDRAIELYAGPFLDGAHLGASAEFERWVEAERQRHAWKYREALEQLAEKRMEAGDSRGSAEAWHRLAAEDPSNKRIALGYMCSLAAAGERARALTFASVHTTLMREEFGAEPAPEVLALAERLRNEPPPAPGPPPDDREDRHHAPASAALDTGPAGDTVEERPPSSDATPIGAGSAGHGAPPPPRRGRRRAELWGHPAVVLPLIVVILLAAAWALRSPSDTIRIAVLPFVNRSDAPEDRYFSDGVTEEILLALSRVDGLQVTGTTSSFAYRDADLDGRDIARSLGVDYLLGGSIRVAADSLRIVVNLEDAEGYQVWSQTYDRRRENLWQTQEEVARAVIDALWPRFGRAPSPDRPHSRMVAPTPAQAVADEHYLRARGYWIERSPHGLFAALEELGQAVSHDPTHGRAYAAIADVYNTVGAWDYGLMPPDSAYPRARAAADRALALDPTLAAGHAALGVALFNYYWQWDRAESALLQARQLNPGDVMTRHWHALLLGATGRVEQAAGELRTAREMDPNSAVVATSLCRHYYFEREYPRAVAQCEIATAVDPMYFQAYLALGLVAVQTKDFDAAEEAYATAAERLGTEQPVILALRAHALGMAGDAASARSLYERVRGMPRAAYVPPQYLALAALGAGEHEDALDWLERALEERSGVMIFLDREPVLDVLRPHPRFREIVADAASAGIRGPVADERTVAGPPAGGSPPP